MRLVAAYRGAEAQRYALEAPPYGAGWPEIAHEAAVIYVYAKEPHEPGAYFVLLLALDAEGNEVGRKRLGVYNDSHGQGGSLDGGSGIAGTR